MKHNENVVICPPCGENVGLPTKRGANKENLFLPLLPRLTAVLPPQGREITAGGFTLIELLVVVLIIGILAAVALPQYKVAVAKSRVASILPIISTLEKAAYAYYLANGEMTTSIHEIDVDIPCTETFAGEDAGSSAAGKPYWTCGKDWLVQFGTSGVMASYCPGHNGSYEDCNTYRDYQMGYHYVSPINDGLHVCLVKNSSALGQSVCKALSIGERDNHSYYIN